MRISLSPWSVMYGRGAERLRTALNDADQAKAAKRIAVALAYTEGVSVVTKRSRP